MWRCEDAPDPCPSWFPFGPIGHPLRNGVEWSGDSIWRGSQPPWGQGIGRSCPKDPRWEPARKELQLIPQLRMKSNCSLAHSQQPDVPFCFYISLTADYSSCSPVQLLLLCCGGSANGTRPRQRHRPLGSLSSSVSFIFLIFSPVVLAPRPSSCRNVSQLVHKKKLTALCAPCPTWGGESFNELVTVSVPFGPSSRADDAEKYAAIFVFAALGLRFRCVMRLI